MNIPITPHSIEPVADNDEAGFRIVQYSQIMHSPAWALCFDALNELKASGFADNPVMLPSWDDPCLTYEGEDGYVMGFMAYRFDQFRSSFYILLAYVRPDFRLCRIHSSLFDALVARSKVRGDILSIECGTHINNLAAQAAFAAQGREKAYLLYRYPIRDHLPGKSHLEVRS